MQHSIILLLLIFSLVACQSQPPPLYYAPWSYADLRAIDAVDAPLPTQDLVAAYLRIIDQELQIRLDLLDQDSLIDYDLYLALDTQAGGTTRLPLQATAGIPWDTLLIVPASGNIQALDPELTARPATAVRVVRDPVLDTTVISLDREALANPGVGKWPNMHFALQVYLTRATSPTTADQLGPLQFDQPPPLPARTLLAFWNTFPAYTPALALRRWDGAHTGPFGGRHGLANLLKTAQSQGIPIALLDLKTPASLSALDYAGGLELVQDMAASGLLILPECLPALPGLPGADQQQAQQFYELLRLVRLQNRQISQGFGLAANPFSYASSGEPSANSHTRLWFVRTQPSAADTGIATANIFRWRTQAVIPIPQYTTDPRQETGTPSGDYTRQATPDGPTLELRRALVAAALAAQDTHSGQATLTLLGGDLPASSWGDPQSARPTFHYLATHPWIKPLDASELLSAALAPSMAWQPDAATSTSRPEPDNKRIELLAALNNAPSNPISQAAWQAYLALSAPVYPQPGELNALRANYLSQVWALLAAAEWAENPAPRLDCTSDPDRDGQAECLLASERFLALFEIDSGALVYAFARPSKAKSDVHQLIAPSFQLIVGLSEPSTWELSRGLASDPAVIPGAFAEPGKIYQASQSADRLIFDALDGTTRKTYSLTEEGIRLEYQFLSEPAPTTLQLPVAIDPWERFSPGWAKRYQPNHLSEGWAWQLSNGLQVSLHTTATFTPSVFTASLPFMAQTEDPNIDYPSGHFLPFPLALAEVRASQDFYVQINVIFPP